MVEPELFQYENGGDCCLTVPLDILKQHLKVEHDREDDLISLYECMAIDYLDTQIGEWWGCAREVESQVAGSGTKYLKLHGAIDMVFEVSADANCCLPQDCCEPFIQRYIPSLLPNGEPVYRAAVQYLVRTDCQIWDPCALYTVRYAQGAPDGEAPFHVKQAIIGMVAQFYEWRVPVSTDSANEVPLHVQQTIQARQRARV